MKSKNLFQKITWIVCIFPKRHPRLSKYTYMLTSGVGLTFCYVEICTSSHGRNLAVANRYFFQTLLTPTNKRTEAFVLYLK